MLPHPPSPRRPGLAPGMVIYPLPVSLHEEPFVLEPNARCELCGRGTYDPDKKERPWARAVKGGRQVLVCPQCQKDRPDWSDAMARCQQCGAVRLSAMLGEIVCRACGHVQIAEGKEGA